MIEKLQNILNELTGRNDLIITQNTKINNDLGLSSLSIVELVCAVEDEFDVEIPNSEIRKFKTVKNVIEFLEKNIDE